MNFYFYNRSYTIKKYQKKPQSSQRRREVRREYIKKIRSIRVIRCLHTTRMPLPELNSGSGKYALEVSEETIWGF